MLSRRHITPSESSLEFDPKWWQEDAYKISQLAALLSGIIASDNDFRDLAADWLVSPNGGGVGEPIGIRRALVVVLSRDEMVLKELLERSFGQFGDKIWIRHTPIMRQEGLYPPPPLFICFRLGGGERDGYLIIPRTLKYCPSTSSFRYAAFVSCISPKKYMLILSFFLL